MRIWTVGEGQRPARLGGPVTVFGLISALALAGCGNVTAGGASEAEVVLSGDGTEQDPGAAGAAAGYALPAGSGEFGPASDQPFQGDVTVEIRVLLLPQTGGVQEISEGSRTVTVDVRGEVPEFLGPILIPPGVYTGVRVVFRRVEANLTAGVLPDGVPIEGLVEVDLGDNGVLQFDRNLPVVVDEDHRLEVTVHLRSSLWLRLATPAAPVVPAQAFENAVEVRSRLVARNN